MLQVLSIRRETKGQFSYDGATPVHLVNFLLCRCEEERVNLKKAAICTIQVELMLYSDSPALKTPYTIFSEKKF